MMLLAAANVNMYTHCLFVIQSKNSKLSLAPNPARTHTPEREMPAVHLMFRSISSPDMPNIPEKHLWV